MKTIWKSLPQVVRWLLITMVLVVVVAGASYGYTALTAKETATVLENLSWVGSNEYEVTLYPLESDIHTFELANASTEKMDVDLNANTTPDLQDVTVDIPKKVTVPALSSAKFDVTVKVGKSAPPLSYTITMEVVR